MSGYIVFGGCLGSGKTTLARLLAERLKAETVMEDVDGHPLIDDFYNDPAAYSLQTEMIFVVMHYHQIMKGVDSGKFNKVVVSDLLFDGDDAYARAALKGDDLEALTGLTSELRGRLPKPGLVVFLRASTAFLMKTSRLRGRDYEKTMTVEHLERMNSAFDEFTKSYNSAPKVIVNAEKMYDIGHGAACLELEKIVKHELGVGSIV
ncbi:MAG: deoxynucleoside kinase [Nitrososphaerota archaeon]|nr:deoxynucleoside kinase [Nitrososphaerota archaeon]